MKVLRATMIAAVCAFSASATSGSVVDVERGGTVSIVAVTPSPPPPPAAPDVEEVAPVVEASVDNDAIVVADQGDCLAGAEGIDESVGADDSAATGSTAEDINPADEVPADEVPADEVPADEVPADESAGC